MDSRTFRFAYALLGAACVVQAAHMVEHVAQVIQKFGLHRAQAHGLLGAIFDREWVHMAYNAPLEAALIVVLVSFARSGFVPWSLGAVVIVQGYHVVEHAVKIYQYYTIGLPDTPGILGRVFPTIWVHFSFNLTVLTMMTLAWLWAFSKVRRTLQTAAAS